MKENAAVDPGGILAVAGAYQIFPPVFRLRIESTGLRGLPGRTDHSFYRLVGFGIVNRNDIRALIDFDIIFAGSCLCSLIAAQQNCKEKEKSA